MNTTKSVTTKEDNNVKYFACNSTITRGERNMLHNRGFNLLPSIHLNKKEALRKEEEK